MDDDVPPESAYSDNLSVGEANARRRARLTLAMEMCLEPEPEELEESVRYGDDSSTADSPLKSASARPRAPTPQRAASAPVTKASASAATVSAASQRPPLPAKPKDKYNTVQKSAQLKADVRMNKLISFANGTGEQYSNTSKQQAELDRKQSEQLSKEQAEHVDRMSQRAADSMEKFGDKVSASMKMAATIKSNRSIEEIERIAAMFEPKPNTPRPQEPAARPHQTPATVCAPSSCRQQSSSIDALAQTATPVHPSVMCPTRKAFIDTDKF
ncbi:hypothetical protein WJX77_001269 [Trebouxia sp. C0004]